MKPITRLLTVGLMFFALATAWGQNLVTQFNPATVTAPVGGTFDVDLKVTGFSGITTLQLPVTFNKTILELVAIKNLAALPSFTAANHSTIAGANGGSGTTGKVTFSWLADPSTNANGSTLADNTTFATLTFKVKTSGTAVVNLANVPPGLEVSRGSGFTPVTVSYQNGGANITAGSGTGGGGGGPAPLVGFKIVANSAYLPAGQTVCMPVTVNDFTGIQSLQFAMHWDPAILRFDCVRNPNLPSWGTSDFVADVNAGLLKAAWGTPSGSGETRPNGSAIVEVCFKAVGAAGTQNIVTIDGNGGPGFVAEAINEAGTDLATAGFGVSDTLFINANPLPATAIALSAVDTAAAINAPVCVDVKVKNFTNMTSVDLPISYDANLLSFQSVSLGTNPLGLATGALPNANFTQSSGLIKFIWGSTTGATVPDNGTIFSVCLMPLPAATVGAKIPVTLGSTAACTPVGVQRKDVGARAVGLTNGSITVKSAPSVVLTAPAVQNVGCNGGSNGSVTVNPTGCAGQYTYTWAGNPSVPSVNAPSLTGLKAGTYTVTVTCSNGGTASATATVTQPTWTLSIPTPTVSNANCLGTGGGSITLAPTGGPASYTYNWAGPGAFTSTAGPSLTNLRSGNYTVTVTETSPAGCTATATMSVNTPTNDLALAPSKTDANCAGTGNGAINLNPTGGTGQPNYTWTGPNGPIATNSPSLANIGAGTYNVTVTDANQCSTSTSIIVGRKNSTVMIPQSTTAVVPPTCSASNGSITINPTNAVAPVTYTWAGNGANSTTNTVSNLGAGNYSVTVRDNNGCTAATSVNLSSTQATIVAGSPVTTESSCFAPATGAITITPSGGKEPYTVTWTGPNGYTGTGTTITALAPGGYTPVIRDADGCALTPSAITVPGPAAALGFDNNPVVTSPLCAGDATGTVSISIKGGTSPYKYAWAGSNPITSVDNPNLSNLKGGTYTVTVTDNKNCTFSAPVVVTERTPINATASFGTTCGSLTVNATGGTGSFTYNWSGPNGFTATAKDIASLQAGAYTVVVRDANNCSFTAPSVTLSANNTGPNIAATAIPVKCQGEATGGVNLTASTANNAYTWSNINGTFVSDKQNPTNLAAGVYTVVVKNNDNGCTSTLPTPITVPGPNTPFTATSGTITPALCPESLEGSIQMNANGGWGGPYTAVWSNNLPQQLNQPALSPGSYSTTVKDAGGCEIVVSNIVVPGPPALALDNVKIDSVTCAGVADGRITISLSGGNGGPYNVVWGQALQGLSIGNLSGGTYTPVVSDSKGCTKVFQAFEVFEPDTLKLGAVTAKTSATASTGSIDMTIQGGQRPYTIVWTLPNGGGTRTTEDLSNLPAGNYEIVVTDRKGCSVSALYTIEIDNALPQLTFNVKDACGNSPDGSITFNIPATVVGPFLLKWTPANPTGELTSSQRSVTIPSLTAGAYNFTVTDVATGFSYTLPTLIQVKALAPATFGDMRQDPAGTSKNGFIILSSNEPLTYNWSDGSKLPSRVNLDAGTYTVTATNAISGCTASETFTLKRIWPAFIASVSNAKDETCLGKKDGAIATAVTGGNPVYTYAWTGPNGFTSAAPNLSGLAPGIYSLTLKDGDGTDTTINITIKTASLLKVTNVTETSNYNNFQVSGAAKCDGAASVIFTGQVGNTTATWSNGATGNSVTTLCAGAYTVTVTDALGCTSVWSDELTAPDALAAAAQASKQISCYGKCDATGRVAVFGGVAPYRVSWALGRNDQLSFPGDSSVIQNLCAGNYAVTVTDRNNVSQSFTVTITQRDSIQIDISDDIQPSSFSNCDGELLAAATGTVGNVTYTWSSNIGHRGNTQRAEELCAGEIVSFIVVDGNGCRAVATDTVQNPADGCLEARAVITPDEQDGRNDVFIIGCIEEYDNTVEIYNRWGQLVFQTEDYNNTSNNWDGRTASGESLPEGVYFYVIYFNDGSGQKRQMKGNVNLLR